MVERVTQLMVTAESLRSDVDLLESHVDAGHHEGGQETGRRYCDEHHRLCRSFRRFKARERAGGGACSIGGGARNGARRVATPNQAGR